MKFNLKQAFTYFYNDCTLKKKILILYFLAVFAILAESFGAIANSINGAVLEKLLKHPEIFITSVAVFIITIVASCFYSGYFAINTNIRIHKPESKLPELNNWKAFFLNGLKIFAGFFVWQIITAFLAFTILFVLVISGIMLSVLLKMWLQNIPVPDKEFFAAAAVIMAIFAIILGITFGLVQLGAYTSFLTNLDLDSFFDFKKIKKIIFKNFKPFMKYFGFLLLLKILYLILFVILCITIIGIIFLPVLQEYYSIISSDIQAQFIRKLFKIE